MFSRAYSFVAKSDVTILTEVQLADLIADRRARGMCEQNLAQLEERHIVCLTQEGEWVVCRFSALQTVLVPRPQWLTDGLRLLSGTPVCHHRLVGIRLGAGLQATGIGRAGLFFVFRMRSGFCSTQEISACLSDQGRDCCPNRRKCPSRVA